MNQYDRKLRGLTIAGTVTLLTVMVLSVYLMPFGYMVMTSFKNQEQIVRNTILPLTQETYEYQGEELPGYRVESGQQYPVYLVPIGEDLQTLALVKTSAEIAFADAPNIFLDPSTLRFVEWKGDIETLERAPQISLYTSTPVTANPDYGVENSKRYPIYQTDVDDEIQQWALIRTPEHIFIDTQHPNDGIIEWTGDIIMLDRTQQIVSYKFRGTNDPENGLVRFKDYPLYQVTLEADVQEEWALVKGASHIFVDITNPEAGVFEWTGDLATLEETGNTYTHFGALNREAGLVGNENFPVYYAPAGEEGAQAQWALIRPGTSTDESLFINTSQDDALVYEVFDDRFVPVLEDATLLYQGKYNERVYGLVSLGTYPVYTVPGTEGDQQLALVRQGTGTEDSIFINLNSIEVDSIQEDIEYIQQPVDLSTLTPVFETESTYRHNVMRLPQWGVVLGDELPLYEAPIPDYGEQWALVAAGTPGRTPTYYVSPSDLESGVFEYSDQWVGSLQTIDRVDFQLDNYGEAWDRINFPRLLFNTLFIALVGLTGTLISCSLVAYGFARFPIPYKNVIFLVLIATIILPRQVTLVPTFAFFSKIGWTGTWLPLLVPHFFANAYNVFLLRQFFQSIPREMDEAAMIDGAGPFRILRSIILPQAYPALVAAGLFHIVFAWNDYFEPLIYLLGNEDLYPISVGVQQFNFVFGQEPHLIQAAALMAMVLPLILFMFSQRFFMQGIVITGVDK